MKANSYGQAALEINRECAPKVTCFGSNSLLSSFVCVEPVEQSIPPTLIAFDAWSSTSAIPVVEIGGGLSRIISKTVCGQLEGFHSTRKVEPNSVPLARRLRRSGYEIGINKYDSRHIAVISSAMPLASRNSSVVKHTQ